MQPCLDAQVAAILARLRRAQVVGCDETGVRVDGRSCWNWVFQNDEVVIHVVRRSRGAGVVAEVMAGHRPAVWVSDLYGAQQGHAEAWQVCLAGLLKKPLASDSLASATAQRGWRCWDIRLGISLSC